MKNSICYGCKFARRVASEELEKEGYVGCCFPVVNERNGFAVDPEYSFVKVGEEVAEGWVDLRSAPFGKPSGVTSNCQLITLGIEKCSKFESEIDE